MHDSFSTAIRSDPIPDGGQFPETGTLSLSRSRGGGKRGRKVWRERTWKDVKGYFWGMLRIIEYRGADA